MLGYEKRSNPFLPEEALRGVFTLAGIVRPSVLLDGKIVGVWKRRGKAAELTWLIPLQSLQRKRIEEGDSSARSAARIKGGILFRKRESPLWNPQRKALDWQSQA